MSLLILPELRHIGFGQLLRPVADGLQDAGKEAEGGRFVDEAEAAHQVPVIVEPLDPVDDVLGLGEGEDPAGEGQAQQLHGGQALAAVGVALLGEGAALHAADAAADVQGAGQGAGGVLLLGDVGDEVQAVQMRAQAAAGGDDRDAVGVQLVHGVLDELGSLGDHVHVHGLVKAHRHGLHLPDGHAAVGQKALEHGDQVLHGVEQGLVPHDDGAAPGEAELAGGEVDQVEQVGDHPGDLPDALVGHARLADLDEVEVVLEQGCVQHGQNAVLLRQLGGRLHVLIGDGLAADQVRAGLQAQEGHLLRRLLLDAGLQLLKVDVALEGQVALGHQSLIFHQLLHMAAHAGDVGLGGGEVVVHDDAVARLDEAGGQDVLAGAALVRREAVGRPENLLQLVAHDEEGLAPGVGVVRVHRGGHLHVAHGVDAGVGEHIHEDVRVVELEGVEAGGAHLRQTLPGGQEVELLHHLDLVHLHGDRLVLVEFDFGHGWKPPSVSF